MIKNNKKMFITPPKMFSRLFQYRDLFFILIWRELLIRYKQTAIGVLWALIQPLSMMLLFVVVFGVILNVDTGSIPKPLFYFSGLSFWTFFSSSLSSSVNALTDHRELITKIYFPRELIVFSKISVVFFDLLISLVLLFGLVFVYKIPLTIYSLWVCPLCILMVLFTCATGLMLGMFNVFYRDVKMASGFLLRFWFFATPVFYSVDAVPLKYKLILFLNPMTFVVENFRRVLLEGRTVVVWQFALEAVFVLVFCMLTYRLFIRLEKVFADVI